MGRTSDDFDRVYTSDGDVVLFKKLGLELFDVPVRKKHLVGSVEVDNHGVVEIWVRGYPTQFWEAVVYCYEGGVVYTVKTGCGTLCDYWESFKLMAEGMMDVKSKKMKPEGEE